MGFDENTAPTSVAGDSDRLTSGLLRADDRFRMLANGIPNSFFFVNTQMLVEFANEEFAKRLGKPIDDIVGTHIADVLGEPVYRPHAVKMQRALAGEDMEYEATVTALDGSPRYLKISTRPARDGQGRIRGVFSESTDITGIKKLEHRTREGEARFRRLAEGVPNYLIYLDPELRVLFINDTFIKTTDWTQDTVLGRHISEVVGEKRYAKRREYYERALAGDTVSHESRSAVGNESGFFKFQYQPSYDEKGEIAGVFSTATDISERRQIEVELEEKQAELRRSNHDLEQFAYVASHDLKAPLRAISVLIDWIKTDLNGREIGEVQQNLGLLDQRAQRLGRLLDDLLSYSRAGRKVGDCRKVDCNVMLKDLIELQAANSGIEVRIDGELPVFDTYGGPLEQVFRNLIGNAIKHHPRPQGLVKVSSDDRGETYLFSVEDDGDGIPEEYGERVFQMFQTLKPRDEKEGSGMGLAIVNRIVQWQGGRIWFEPGSTGCGTVFKFIWNKDLPSAGSMNSEEER